MMLIFVGGGSGSVLRYFVQGVVQSLTGSVRPWGTMIVNITGCLAIGVLAGLLMGSRSIGNDKLIAFLMIGVLGGYTTFSSFSLETIKLSDDRALLYAGLNVVLSVGLGLAATWIGKQMIEHLYGT
jgi:CrcB protein